MTPTRLRTRTCRLDRRRVPRQPVQRTDRAGVATSSSATLIECSTCSCSRRTRNGSLEAFEIADLDHSEIGELRAYESELAMLLSEDDVVAVANAIEPGSSAAVLVWENSLGGPVRVPTYDAKDPDTAFPPIEPLLPPEGAPNVLIVLLDDVGFGASSAFGGPCRTPTAERLAAGGSAVQPVPHDGAVRADPAGAADRPQPPLGRDGQHHRDGDVGSGQQLAAAEHQGAAGDDPEAERLLDGAVRQVPRGAGVAVLADGAVRRVAVRGRRVRDVLRVHRRGEQPVGPRPVRRHHAGRAAGHAGGGLPPHRGPDRPRGRLDAPAEGADAGQAVLRLLRAGRDARPAPRAQGVGRQVRGPVRRRLGRPARAHLRPAEGARGHPRGRRADRPARRDPGLGRHARRAQAGAGPPDGGVRRVPGAHRPPRRPADRRHRRPRGASTTRSSTTSSATTAPRPRAP